MRAVKEEERIYDPYEMHGNTSEGGEAIKRWNKGINSDFAARMDWSITSTYGQANHHPVAVVNGDATKNILEAALPAGSNYQVNSIGSRDPDGNALRYAWFFYAEPSTYQGTVTIQGDKTAAPMISIPEDAHGKTIHIVLELSDDGAQAS